MFPGIASMSWRFLKSLPAQPRAMPGIFVGALAIAQYLFSGGA
jgi:hypothetical protein